MSNYFWAIFSGLLLGCGWLIHPIFAFVGFVPLLYISEQASFWQRARYCYLAFLVWNFTAAWWLIYTDWEVGIVMFAIVPALMSLPIMGAYMLQNKRIAAPYLVPVFWLAYEYIQYQSDFLWSWLTLGNALAYEPTWIQWYEYTGALGGSCFILVINILAYWAFKLNNRHALKYYAVIVLLFVIAIGESNYLTLPKKNEKEVLSYNVIIVQPNIDPVTEKLDNGLRHIPVKMQARQLVNLAQKAITNKTDLVVFPEAVLGIWFEQDGLEHKGNYPAWDTLHHFFDQYPHTTFLLGMNMHRWVQGAERNDFTAHKEGENNYRKRYNATLLYQKGKPKQFHHKSRRVPSGEHLPLPHFLKPLIPAISQTITPEYPPRLLTTTSGLAIGSLICYESTFGSYAGKVASRGADIFCIVTEDAYWRNTSQPLQHLYLDRLRAIEHRRKIIRASNHGFSCLIDQYGAIQKMTKTNTAQTLSIELALAGKPLLTFYSIWGDWTGVLAWSVILIVCIYRLPLHKK